MNPEDFATIIESGLGDAEPGSAAPEVCAARALITAGITVGGCGDDEFALAEEIEVSVPQGFDMTSWSTIAERCVARIMADEGGFVALEA